MIYIKDMDMPVDCLACRISCKHESYLVTGRPKDCPLEEAKDGDLISRADAIEAVRKELVCDGRHETHDKTCRFIADVLLSALPSAETTGALDDAIAKYVADGLMELPSAEAVQTQAEKCEDCIHNGTNKDKITCKECVSAEAVQGEWIFRTDIPIGGGRESAGYVCSNCRKDYFHVDGMNFCPNCGAKMKGGEDE